MIDKEMLKNVPSFITENEDGTYTIKTRDGDFVMEEMAGDVVEKCERLAEKTKTSYEALLAVKSIIKPSISDNDFSKLKGSTFMKLKIAVVYVYGLNDFL